MTYCIREAFQFLNMTDTIVLDFIQNNLRCGFPDFLMPKISALGNGGAVWLAVCAVLLINKKYRKAGIVVLAGLLTGFLVGNVVLKHLIARPRPCWLNGSVTLLIQTPRDYSFPSGHTLSSFIAAFILTRFNKRFGYAAIPAAALIAFSRLYLYVHYPSDILGGILLAAVIAFTLTSKRMIKFWSRHLSLIYRS